MKKILTRIIIMLLVILILNSLQIKTHVHAFNIIEGADEFLTKRYTEEEIDTDALQTTSNNIYNILLAIGIVIAVAVGMVIGIQFMIGSVEEKAKIKETIIPYIIGVTIIFSGFTIWKIVVNIGNEVAPTGAATGQKREPYQQQTGQSESEITSNICPECQNGNTRNV